MRRLLARAVPGLAAGNGRQRRSSIFTATTVTAFTAFLGLLALVRANRNLEADVVATLRFQRNQHPVLSRAMELISWLGFRPQSLIFPATMVAGNWLLGHRRDSRFLLMAWAASFVSYTTKRLVRRPRPSGNGIVVVDANLRDSSFPSGHTLHYVVFWGFVTYLWYRRSRVGWRRWVPVATATTAISLVGPSRIYLGHHWLTDVLASYSLGTGFLFGLIELHQREADD